MSARIPERLVDPLPLALLAGSLLLIGAPVGSAGQDTTAAGRLNAMVEDARTPAAQGESSGVPPPAARGSGAAGAPGEPALAYADSAALEEYATWGLEHRRGVFEWQHRSSQIIFFAVLFLVLTGVGFSGIQFYRSMREPVRGTGTEEGEESAVSHIEFSAGGVKISSPVLGVIILGLSLAFFYLYLVFVYPISETF